MSQAEAEAIDKELQVTNKRSTPVIDDGSEPDDKIELKKSKLNPCWTKSGFPVIVDYERHKHGLPQDSSGRTRYIPSRWHPSPEIGYNVEKGYPEHYHGKRAGNNEKYWGETLFDFYYLNRFGTSSAMDFTTSSREMDYRRSLGQPISDIDHFTLESVLKESVPLLVQPADIAKLTMDNEANVIDSSFQDRLDTRAPAQYPGMKNSVFAKRKLFIPFSAPICKYPKLQKHIPLQYLPRKLIVHDPWKLLSVRYDGMPTSFTMSESTVDPSTSPNQAPPKPATENIEDLAGAPKHKEIKTLWELKDDIVHVYKLSLTDDSEEHIKKHWDFVEKTSILKQQGITPICQPKVEEAHLYLAPDKKIGSGHHSYVYNAVFELPRASIVPLRQRKEGELCEACFQQICERKLKNPDKGELFDKSEDGTATLNIELPAVPACHHSLDPSPLPVPVTATCTVAAKLSFENDNHLPKEGINYQNFPKHFAEHWSGYNIIKPVRQPVPIGPIVPQFYGYYVHDDEATLAKEQTKEDDLMLASGDPIVRPRSNRTAKKHQYLSPILLVEHCGTPIEPSALTLDQKQECATMLHRFQRGGWAHNSCYDRNIVSQFGPLEAWPSLRGLDPAKRSFRLIDFGRSRPIAEKQIRLSLVAEEKQALELFDIPEYSDVNFYQTVAISWEELQKLSESKKADSPDGQDESSLEMHEDGARRYSI